MTNDEMMK